MPDNPQPKLCCGKPPLQFQDRKVGSDIIEYIVTCCVCGRFDHAPTKSEAITTWNDNRPPKSGCHRRR